MDRYQFEDSISAYIENNLSIKQRKQVDAYLEDHPEAKQQIESVKQVMTTMKSMQPVSTSVDFMKNLNERINTEKESASVVKSTRSFAGYTPLMASLSAVIVVAVVLLGLEYMPESNKATLTPTMSEQQFDEIPLIPTQVKEEMLAESEEDSTKNEEDSRIKHNFDDRIQLVGDKRP